MTRAMRIWFLCGCAVVSALAAPAAWRVGAIQWSSGTDAAADARVHAGVFEVGQPQAGQALAGAGRQGGVRAR